MGGGEEGCAVIRRERNSESDSHCGVSVTLIILQSLRRCENPALGICVYHSLIPFAQDVHITLEVNVTHYWELFSPCSYLTKIT